MEIDDIIDKICQTEKRGKELLAQAFLIGVGWGRRDITDNSSLNKAINRLIKDENLVNIAEMSCFYKDECYKKYVNSTNYKLFAYTNQNLDQIDEQYDLEQDQNAQQFNNSQTKNKLQISDQKISKSQELKCEICKNIINKNNYEYAKLTCQHDFHLKCLCQNLQKSEPQCPICQYKIKQDYIVTLYEQLPNEYKSTCPNIDCENSFVYHDQQIFECKKCDKSWCLECRQPFEEQHQCRIDMDSFKMKIGDRFKYCELCKKSFLVKHNGKFQCNCNKGEQSVRGKIVTFFLKPFKYIQG